MMEPISGSIDGKHDFYKTIAQKNTTSLKNNHTSHSYVQTSPKCQIKSGNQSVAIEGVRASGSHHRTRKRKNVVLLPSAVFEENPSSLPFVQSRHKKTSVNAFKTWCALISHDTKPSVEQLMKTSSLQCSQLCGSVQSNPTW